MTDSLDLGSYKPNPDDDGDANQVSNAFTVIETIVNALIAEFDDLDIGTIPTDITTLQNAVSTLQSQVTGLGSWVSVTGSWLLASSDSPVFVLTAPSSMATTLYNGTRLKITDTTDKYGIVVKVAGTTVTVLVEASASIITHPTAVAYSYGKAPPGFPTDPTKWEVSLSRGSDDAKSGPSGTNWYLFDAALKLDIPIGAWDVYYRCASEIIDTGTQIGMAATLSTSTSSETDSEFTSIQRGAGTTANRLFTLTSRRTVVVTAKTPYYLIAHSTGSGATSINFRGSSAHATVIRARCAYL